MYYLEWAGKNEELSVVALIAASVITIITLNLVCTTIRRVWLGQQQLELKQAMVDQGMTADEIERVLRS